MNKTRRKILEGIIEVLQEQKTAIESVCEEEQEAYDNLPDGIQDSERGQTLSDNVSDLEQASSDLDDLIEQLQGVADK